LCLLTAIFAVEAKLGWFGPAGSPTAQISAAKLQPDDLPKTAAQGHVPSFPAILFVQVAAILAFVALRRPATAMPLPPTASIISGCPGFFPSLFFRPPPSR